MINSGIVTSHVPVSQCPQISPNKKHEDEGEDGGTEQDLGCCIDQPVAVDCTVEVVISISLAQPLPAIACVNVVVLGGARHLLHHQGLAGEETFENSSWTEQLLSTYGWQ